MAERFKPERLKTPEGEQWATQGVGEVEAGKYRGREAFVEAPWKCPACGKPNEGRLALGCVHCGSGKPGVHVGVPQAKPKTAPPRISDEEAERWRQMLPERPYLNTANSAIEQAFDEWVAGVAHELDTAGMEIARRAYHAGWIRGALNQARQTQAQVMTAPPVTADLEELAPAGKVRRTIVAALEIFRDGVLQTAEAEIASGEWCSIEEVDQLLAQMREEEP